MKVYFTGSLHNRDIDIELYKKMAQAIEKCGHKVNSSVLKTSAEELDRLDPEKRREFYRKLKKEMQKNDVVVAEASYPSTINIGHEISLALDLAKPIVCLYQPGRDPGVIQGIDSERLIVLEYTMEDMADIVSYGLEEADELMDVRFNFFISSQIGNYLDWIAKDKRIPRAVYLRKLIEDEIDVDDEYQESLK